MGEVKEKTVAELKAELESLGALASFPESDYNVKKVSEIKQEIQKQKEAVKTVLPNVASEAKTTEVTVQPEIKIQSQVQTQPETTQPLEKPNKEIIPQEEVVSPQKLFSFDNILERVVQKKWDKIDAKAKTDKEQIVDTITDKLTILLELAVSDTPLRIQQPEIPKQVPVQQQPTQTEPIPQPQQTSHKSFFSVKKSDPKPTRKWTLKAVAANNGALAPALRGVIRQVFSKAAPA
jgi:hypothetical protein